MIKAEFDSRALERALRDMARRADFARPFFDVLKPRLRQDQRDHGRRKEGPLGRWPALAKSTLAKRKRSGKRRSKLLGRLTAAVKYRASGDELRATSQVKYSSVHQDGGKVGHGAELPARPFLWLSADFVEDAAQAALEYITKNWRR